MTRVEVLKPVGARRVWVPGALIQQTSYQQTSVNTFNAPGGKARFVERKDDALGFVVAEFPAGVAPIVTMTSRIATRNYSVLTPREKSQTLSSSDSALAHRWHRQGEGRRDPH